MIELNGYAINTRHVATVGAVTCTRGKRYTVEVTFAGNDTPLALMFDGPDTATQSRAMLIAHMDADDDARDTFGRRRTAALRNDVEPDRAVSVIRRTPDARTDDARPIAAS